MNSIFKLQVGNSTGVKVRIYLTLGEEFGSLGGAEVVDYRREDEI